MDIDKTVIALVGIIVFGVLGFFYGETDIVLACIGLIGGILVPSPVGGTNG